MSPGSNDRYDTFAVDGRMEIPAWLNAPPNIRAKDTGQYKVMATFTRIETLRNLGLANLDKPVDLCVQEMRYDEGSCTDLHTQLLLQAGSFDFTTRQGHLSRM